MGERGGGEGIRKGGEKGRDLGDLDGPRVRKGQGKKLSAGREQK